MMRIEIVDLPNGQIIKNIKLEMQFENGKVQSITHDVSISKPEQSNELPSDILDREPKIPVEMTDIKF